MPKAELAAFDNLASQNKHLAANLLRLEARYDAISALLEIVGSRMGIDPKKMHAEIEKATAVRQQTLLEHCETKHPALAASLDLRSTASPDLFD